MAFADYVDLRAAVVEQVGNADISDVLDRLTLLAEAQFNRQFRTTRQVTRVTLTFSAGIASLPDDFLSVVALTDSVGRSYVQQSSHSIRAVSGSYYAIEGGQIRSEGISGDLAFVYYAKIPTITAAPNTNWLLDEYPGAYLYAVSCEAAKYLKDVEAAQAYGDLRNVEIAEAIGDDQFRAYSSAESRAAGATP